MVTVRHVCIGGWTSAEPVGETTMEEGVEDESCSERVGARELKSIGGVEMEGIGPAVSASCSACATAEVERIGASDADEEYTGVFDTSSGRSGA